MPKKVTVVDYGLSNLFSVNRALAYVGVKADLAATPSEISKAEALILPGVGAFRDGMRNLQERKMVEPIREAVGQGIPLLGICLGMQLLFDGSEEFGDCDGLGLIPGRVARLHAASVDGVSIKVPHIGWQELYRPAPLNSWDGSLLDGLGEADAVYFVHSYIPNPADESVALAHMRYGGHSYCAVAQQGSVMGCQFHPEKSGPVGLKILRNFVTRN